jgi:hypothetical protein
MTGPREQLFHFTELADNMALTYESIVTTTLSSAASSITLSSIASSWTDLKLIFTGTTSGAQYLGMQFNGSTSAIYSNVSVYGNGSSAGSYSGANTAYIYLSGIPTTSTTIPFLVETDIFSYAGSTNKTVFTQLSLDKNGTGGTERLAGIWRSTSAINSIRLYIPSDGATTFSSGTTATLYGIKNA